MGFIYCMTSPSGKQYIGQTIHTVEGRVRAHEKDDGCCALYNAIQLYGIETFKVETLLQCPDKLLNEYETGFIWLYETLCPFGYNIRTGGSNGKHCDESKERMRQSKLGEKNHNFGKPRSAEFKALMKEKKSGANHHFFGKALTQEHKLNLSKAHKHTQPELPMYMVYVKARPEHYCAEGYSIVNHPRLKSKYFTSKKLTLEEKHKLALDYLQSDMGAVQRLDVGGSSSSS
jgi:group I intron endonuclease